MSNCNYCNSEIESKSNKKYCSASCKQKAYRERNQSEVVGLSDNGINSNSLYGTSIITNRAMSGVGDIVQNSISQHRNSLQPPTPPRDVTSMRRRAGTSLLCAGIGAIISYSLTKDKSQRLQSITLGALGGGLAWNVVELIFDPFNAWGTKENVTNSNVTLSDGTYNDGQVFSARQYASLPTHTIQWQGKWGNFLERVGYNDIIMVYGGQGSGKSHLVSQLAGELGRDYDVLYVTAEEGVANHVQDRFKQYGLNNKNVHILPTRRKKDVLDTVNKGNYTFVIIDSLQGLGLSYIEQSQFLEDVVKNPRVHSLIFLNQMNKSGEFKGMQELGHITSAEIKVENGIAETIKNRQSSEKPKENVFSSSNAEVGKIMNIKTFAR